jgi:hypothetical protein
MIQWKMLPRCVELSGRKDISEDDLSEASITNVIFVSGTKKPLRFHLLPAFKGLEPPP